ncbi:uncharacterized protein LOC124359651 isoform X1 [Homalodisca vitripennis]|uniref:uncharacterized protein LOC124359651 isoform X1 n=1 Tax=Homalodisca vitripennis TaxID=197043 RepID=UPI001EEC2940|nr:uncharacterized protein LOC124359651 isoform X1 [Homalodisca vitripennis]
MEETSEVNPLNLTLDEVIALNRLKNRREELDIANEEIRFSNCSSNGISIRDEDIDNRLRKMPGFGTKPIHYRLGNNIYKRLRFKNYRQKHMYNCVNKAKMSLWRKHSGLLGGIRVRNPVALKKPFVSTLTRNSIYEFNRLNGGLMRNAFISAPSIISHQSILTKRHLARACLNSDVQEEIKNFLSLTDTEMVEDLVEQFRPIPRETNKTITERFLR